MAPRPDPVPPEAPRRFGWVALVVLAIIVTIFVGYNLFYLKEAL